MRQAEKIGENRRKRRDDTREEDMEKTSKTSKDKKEPQRHESRPDKTRQGQKRKEMIQETRREKGDLKKR